MISRTHRFIGPKSLRFVYKHGLIVRGPFFSVKAVLNQRRQTYRVAVVVSRKVHKSAVARNRIRRRLYETVRQLENEINRPYDIILTVFNDKVLEEKPKKLAGIVRKQLSAAGVIGK